MSGFAIQSEGYTLVYMRVNTLKILLIRRLLFPIINSVYGIALEFSLSGSTLSPHARTSPHLSLSYRKAASATLSGVA